MLKDWAKPERPDDEEIKARLDTARAELAKRQTRIKEYGLPVLVVMDGWGAAGKGNTLGRVIKNLDPRFFKVETLKCKSPCILSFCIKGSQRFGSIFDNL